MILSCVIPHTQSNARLYRFFLSENRKTALRAEFDELVAKIILSIPLKPVALVKAFAVTHGLKLGKTIRILPTEHGTDGAFAAVLRWART